MSNQPPYFIKNLLDVKNIFNNNNKKKKFISKFKSLLKISEEKKNDILQKIQLLENIEINAYLNSEINDYDKKYFECYNKILKSNSKLNEFINSSNAYNKIYYRLKSREYFELFCENNYGNSLENVYIWFDNNSQIYFYNGDYVFKKDIKNYDEKHIQRLINKIFKNEIDENTERLKNLNWDDLYYYLIDQEYKINLSNFIKFLIKLINYEETNDETNNETNNNEIEILELFEKVIKNHEDIYEKTPFVEAKESKLEKLKNNITIEKIIFEPKINISHGDLKVNNENIFDLTNIKLNIKNLYTSDINTINEEFKKFYSIQINDLDHKLSTFVSLIDMVNNLYEKINSEKYSYISSILSNKLIKLPLEILEIIEKNNYVSTNIDLQIKIYKYFSKWVNICKLTNTINIYKYSYFLLLNNVLFSNFDFLNNLSEKNKEKIILEEFMIDVNLNVLYNYELYEDIYKIKSKLGGIKLWYWNNESYLSILSILEIYMREEKMNKQKKIIDTNNDLDKIIKIKYKHIDLENILLTTEDLVESNNIFSNISCDNSDIELNYFKKNNQLSKSKEIGIINNPEKLLIDTSSLIFKFVDLDKINYLLKSNILLMYIQIINCIKDVNFTNCNFPYQFPPVPTTDKPILTILNSKSGITYGGIFIIWEKNLKNNYLLVSNKLNTFGIENNNKTGYIDYFNNYISTKNPLYLNKIINPFVKYGWELLNENDTNFIPIDYSQVTHSDIDGKNYLNLSNFESKKNFYTIINQFANLTNDDLLDGKHFDILNQLSKTQFNNFFYVLSVIKKHTLIVNFVKHHKYLFIKNIIQNVEDIENILKSNYSDELKLIYLTNGIKFHFILYNYDNLNIKSFELLPKLLEMLDKFFFKMNNFKKDIINEKNNLKCDSKKINFKYFNYQIPYLKLTNENKIEDLKEIVKLRRFYGKNFNQLVDLTYPDKNFKNNGIKNNSVDSYEIIEPIQFDNTMGLIDKTYKNNRIRNNFYMVENTYLYPKQTEQIKNKNIGFFVGNDDVLEYFKNYEKYDCVDISEFRPSDNDISLSQMIKINPKIENTPFVNMFKYILFLYKLSNNENIGHELELKCGNEFLNNQIINESSSFILPELDKFEGSVSDVDFSNGHFKFVVEQISNSDDDNINNLYYSPPNIDVIFEYIKGTEIRFEVSNNKCVKYYIGEIIRFPDPWMDDFFSICVKYCREPNSIIKLTELKITNTELKVSNFESNSNQKINTSNNTHHKIIEKSKKLDDFFIFSVENLDLLLPTFTAGIGFEEINKTSSNTNDSLSKAIINNTLNFIANFEIFSSDNNLIYGIKYCGHNMMDQLVLESYDYEQIIKKIYVSKIIPKTENREIYICGRDLFGLLNQDELVNIYNKSPNVTGQIVKSKIKNADFEYKFMDLTKNNSTHSMQILNEIKNYTVYKKKNYIGWELKFNGNIFYTMDDINNRLFKGIIEPSGKIKFNYPYYLDNPIFYDEKYFKFVSDNDFPILKPSKSNVLYSKNLIKLDSGLVKLFLPNDASNEKIYLSLFKLKNQASHMNYFLNKLINAFKNNESNIICWIDSSEKIIVNIDIINLGLRFDIKYGKSLEEYQIIFLNMYVIILDYSNIDWRILRWINTEDKINNEWETDKKRIFLAQNKNNYYMIIFFPENYQIIQIDSNTYLPVFKNLHPELLVQIIKFYAYDLEIMGDLLPIIVKNNLDKFIYNSIVSDLKTNEKLNEIGNEKLKLNLKMQNLINKYLSINKMCEKKINYYLNYEYIDINETNFEYYDNIFYQQFYFKDNQLNSLGDFILYSLVNDKPEYQIKIFDSDIKISMNVFTFNYLYFKLKNKIYLEFGIDKSRGINEIEKILEENDIYILKPVLNSDDKKYFELINPLEFYYQYVFGYFARDIQLSLSNEIFRDLTGYQIVRAINFENENENLFPSTITENLFVENYRLSKFMQINPKCFVKIENKSKQNPNIYNLIMGGGKTSMITPLVIIKYLQFKTTNVSKSNFYLILPEKLVNPSCDKLSSLFGLYLPINVRKCIETRENKNFEQKFILTYLETLEENIDGELNYRLDPNNLNVFVLSDTSLKSGLINNYNTVINSNIESNHVYLFDEIDTVINPITSELNYPLSQTIQPFININILFDIMYKIYSNIFKNGSKSFKLILDKYPNQFKLNPFAINNMENHNFISELKIWVRHCVSKNLKDNYLKIGEIISCGFGNDLQKKIDSMDLAEINLIQSLNYFIDVIFIQSLSMTNRVDYGTCFDKKDNLNKNTTFLKNKLIDTNTNADMEKILNKIKNYFSHKEIKLPTCDEEPIIKQFNNELKLLSNNVNHNMIKNILPDDKIGNKQDLSKYTIIPFSSNEDPVRGSKFSSPIMTLALTIINYITRSGNPNIVDDDGIKEIIEIIYENYINSNNKNMIVNEFNKIFYPNYPKFEITEIIEKYNYLSDNEIQNIKSNSYFIYLFCQKVCLESINIDGVRFNVSGVDLMESTNIANRSGFSGTVNIPKPIDTNKDKQLEIRLDQNTIVEIENILNTRCEIFIYDSKSDILDELLKIVGSNNFINTIIDSGGVFVNLTPQEIWDKLKLFGSNKMYFWNMEDRPEEFIKTSPYSFGTNLSENYYPINVLDKIYYYYDQKHTTGIDAKIPLGSIGLVFLNKSSRYRDVVQSMFRMRKLKTEHKIIFCLPDDIAFNINIGTNNNKTNIKKLINWFKNNEQNYYVEQEIIGNIQNINTIERIIKINSKILSKSNNKSCVFLSNNYYRDIISKKTHGIGDILEGKKNWLILDLEKQIENIKSHLSKLNNKLDIKSLIDKLGFKINKDTGLLTKSKTQSKSQIQTQTQTQFITKTSAQSLTLNKEQINELENINEEISLRIRTFGGIKFNLEDYFKFENKMFYSNYKNEIIYLSNNIGFYENELYPSNVIYLYELNKILIVPNLEGFKLIDYLLNLNPSKLPKYLIFDSTGTFYTSNIDKLKLEEIEQIKSFIRIILNVETNRNIISDIDIQNFSNYLANFETDFVTRCIDILIKSSKTHLKNIGFKLKNKLIT